MSTISDNLGSPLPPENGPENSAGQRPLSEDSRPPWQASSPSLDKLYKEIYLSRRIQKLLGEESEEAVKVEVKKRVESRLFFQITYNALLIVSLVFIGFNVAKTWLGGGGQSTMRQMGVSVSASEIPLQLDATYGESTIRVYSGDSKNLKKTLLESGSNDISFSVFLDLRDRAGLEYLELKVDYLPPEFSFIENSTVVNYANITSTEDGLSRITQYQSEIPAYEPTYGEGTLTFYIEVPEDYTISDGLCLSFQLHAAEPAENTETDLTKEITLHMSAYDITETAP